MEVAVVLVALRLGIADVVVGAAVVDASGLVQLYCQWGLLSRVGLEGVGWQVELEQHPEQQRELVVVAGGREV